MRIKKFRTDGLFFVFVLYVLYKTCLYWFSCLCLWSISHMTSRVSLYIYEHMHCKMLYNTKSGRNCPLRVPCFDHSDYVFCCANNTFEHFPKREWAQNYFPFPPCRSLTQIPPSRSIDEYENELGERKEWINIHDLRGANKPPASRGVEVFAPPSLPPPSTPKGSGRPATHDKYIVFPGQIA